MSDPARPSGPLEGRSKPTAKQPRAPAKEGGARPAKKIKARAAEAAAGDPRARRPESPDSSSDEASAPSTGVATRPGSTAPARAEPVQDPLLLEPPSVFTLDAYRDHHPEAAATGAGNAVREQIAAHAAPPDDPLQFAPLASLLASIPPSVDGVDGWNDTGLPTLADDVPTVEASYEARFLLKPRHGDRLCVSGDNCVGLQIDPANGFVLAEFLLPGTEPSEPARLCLLCNRSETTLAWMDRRDDGNLVPPNMLVQDHCNIIGVSGEYAPDACIATSPHRNEGIVAPIVRFVRSHYSIATDAATQRVCVKQKDEIFYNAARDRQYFQRGVAVEGPSPSASSARGADNEYGTPCTAGTLYNAVVHRVAAALALDEPGVLAHAAQTPEARDEVSHLLNVFADSHLAVIVHANEQGAPSDAEIAPVLAAHPPGVRSECHEATLPDFVHIVTQCSVRTESRQKRDPFVHLLSKALPSRCLIRNLCDIVQKYAVVSDDFYAWILALLRCSLLGGYRHARVRPTYEQRLALYRAFTRHPEYAHVRDDVLSWVVRQEMIVFYVLKEYLVFCVRYDPALHATLRRQRNWDSFEASVLDAMDHVRRVYVATGGTDWYRLETGADGREHMTTIDDETSRTRLEPDLVTLEGLLAAAKCVKKQSKRVIMPQIADVVRLIALHRLASKLVADKIVSHTEHGVRVPDEASIRQRYASAAAAAARKGGKPAEQANRGSAAPAGVAELRPSGVAELRPSGVAPACPSAEMLAEAGVVGREQQSALQMRLGEMRKVPGVPAGVDPVEHMATLLERAITFLEPTPLGRRTPLARVRDAARPGAYAPMQTVPRQEDLRAWGLDRPNTHHLHEWLRAINKNLVREQGHPSNADYCTTMLDITRHIADDRYVASVTANRSLQALENVLLEDASLHARLRCALAAMSAHVRTDSDRRRVFELERHTTENKITGMHELLAAVTDCSSVFVDALRARYDEAPPVVDCGIGALFEVCPPDEASVLHYLTTAFGRTGSLRYQRAIDALSTAKMTLGPWFAELPPPSDHVAAVGVAPETTALIRRTVHALVQRASDDPSELLDTSILFAFGVGHASLAVIDRARATFDKNESDGPMRKELSGSLTDRELAVTHSFFYELHARLSLHTFPLPAYYARAQIAALRQRYSVPAAQPLPPALGRFYVCTSCRTFKGFLVDTDHGKGMLNVHAYGLDRVIVDADTGRLYCGKRADGEKKRSATHFYDNQTKVLKKDASRAREDNESPPCAEALLRPVQLIGRMLQFNGMLITLCCGVGCGCPMVWSIARCVARQDGSGVSSLPVCGNCVSAGHDAAPVCAHCGEKQPSRETWQRVSVLDDTKPEMPFRTVAFCRTHADALTGDAMPHLSDIFRRIEQLDVERLRATRPGRQTGGSLQDALRYTRDVSKRIAGPG